MLARLAMPLFALVRPLIFALDPERAHRLTIAALRLIPAHSIPASDPALAVTVAGLCFPSPIGLAAGFDKNAEVPDAMLGLGFGFVEVGTITPLAQCGNPKPRLFRLSEDEAVINRMGFNNEGQEAALARLAARKRRGIVGVNIGANKDAPDRIADYAQGVRAMSPVADYLTINISSPNTPGLRALQGGDALDALLDAVSAARAAGGPPVFLKVAPDLEPAEIDAVVKVASGRVDALIIGNTTLSRPALRSPLGGEAGGLSGAPLAALALERLRDFRRASGGSLPLVAAGGIANAEQAWTRIKAGASLVQLYSALVYRGPALARIIADGLPALMARDGFASVADAIGSDAR
jgi:dihydroorotate dehydrogenase